LRCMSGSFRYGIARQAKDDANAFRINVIPELAA
jgi:hypothetical protein